MNVKTTLGRNLALALSLGLVHMAIPAAEAAPHLVDAGQVAAALVERAQSRQDKIELFQRALGAPEVQQRAQSMGLDAAKLSRAIPHLSDSELADLAARATRAPDVAAGHSRHGGGEAGLVLIGVALLLAGLLILAALADEYDYDDWDCYDCW